MRSQLVFVRADGAAEHGVAVADADGAGAGPEFVADGAGVGVADGAGAGAAVALGPAVEAMPGAVEAGAAGPVAAGAAGELAAAPAGAGVADAGGLVLPARAMGATNATSDMAGLADLAACAAQAPGGPFAVLEALSMALMCGPPRVAIPATRAIAKSPIIGIRCARGRSTGLRYRRASLRRYERTLRYDIETVSLPARSPNSHVRPRRLPELPNLYI